MNFDFGPVMRGWLAGVIDSGVRRLKRLIARGVADEAEEIVKDNSDSPEGNGRSSHISDKASITCSSIDKAKVERLIQQGNLYCEQGQSAPTPGDAADFYFRAAKVFEDAVAIWPSSISARKRLVWAYSKLGRWGEAIFQAGRCTGENSDAIDLAELYCMTAELSRKQFDETKSRHAIESAIQFAKMALDCEDEIDWLVLLHWNVLQYIAAFTSHFQVAADDRRGLNRLALFHSAQVVHLLGVDFGSSSRYVEGFKTELDHLLAPGRVWRAVHSQLSGAMMEYRKRRASIGGSGTTACLLFLAGLFAWAYAGGGKQCSTLAAAHAISRSSPTVYVHATTPSAPMSRGPSRSIRVSTNDGVIRLALDIDIRDIKLDNL